MYNNGGLTVLGIFTAIIMISIFCRIARFLLNIACFILNILGGVLGGVLSVMIIIVKALGSFIYMIWCFLGMAAAFIYDKIDDLRCNYRARKRRKEQEADGESIIRL